MIALIGFGLLAVLCVTVVALFRSSARSLRFGGIGPTPEEARVHAQAKAERDAIENASVEDLADAELEEAINDTSPVVLSRK